MADYYYDGVGGRKDFEAAANMYSIAAYHGDPQVGSMIDIVILECSKVVTINVLHYITLYIILVNIVLQIVRHIVIHNSSIVS